MATGEVLYVSQDIPHAMFYQRDVQDSSHIVELLTISDLHKVLNAHSNLPVQIVPIRERYMPPPDYLFRPLSEDPPKFSPEIYLLPTHQKASALSPPERVVASPDYMLRFTDHL